MSRIHSLVIFLFSTIVDGKTERSLILTGTVARTISLKNISNVRYVISSRYLCIDPGLVQAQQLFPRFVDITCVTLDPLYDHGERVLFRLVPHVYEHVQGLHQLGYIVGVDRGHRVLGKIEHEDQRQGSLNKNFLLRSTLKKKREIHDSCVLVRERGERGRGEGGEERDEEEKRKKREKQRQEDKGRTR